MPVYKVSTLYADSDDVIIKKNNKIIKKGVFTLLSSEYCTRARSVNSLKSLVHTCDSNANARANDVHTSNSNAKNARYAGAVKDSQTFSKMAVESKALASVSLLFVVFQYRVLDGRKRYLSNATENIRFYYMEKSVLLGTKPLVDSIRHFIRDPSGVFSVCHLCESRIVQ